VGSPENRRWKNILLLRIRRRIRVDPWPGEYRVHIDRCITVLNNCHNHYGLTAWDTIMLFCWSTLDNSVALPWQLRGSYSQQLYCRLETTTLRLPWSNPNWNHSWCQFTKVVFFWTKSTFSFKSNEEDSINVCSILQTTFSIKHHIVHVCFRFSATVDLNLVDI
jgi:hypothetical protein